MSSTNLARIIAFPRQPATLSERTARIFREVLPSAWPGFSARPSQARLTGSIAETFDAGGHLVCEGPCGVGKSLAYLIPAILRARATGRPVIVATASIALQEQLVTKDLPALREALRDELATPLRFALLKGRGNYLCFAGETRVITRDGIERIDRLAGGTHKLLDGNGQWVDAPVKSYGTQRLMRVVLSRGHAEQVVYATPEHRWILRKANTPTAQASEKPTRSLVPGDRIPSVMPRSIAARLRPSPFGIAHGITFGDGTLFGETTNGFRTATLVLHGAKRALSRWFPNSQVTELHTAEYGYSEDALRVWDLPRFFKDLPSIDESPSYLYGWLAGWFAADGSVGENGMVALTSARRETLEFAVRVCLRLGIEFGDISTRTREGKGGRASDIHTLRLVAATLGDDFFLREKHATNHVAVRRRPSRSVWTVRSVELTDRVEEVFCAEVPTTHSFALDRFILTGNCLDTLNEPAPTFLSREEREELARVDAWGKTSATGDRAELPLIVRDGVWNLRSRGTDDCLRDGCEHFDACHARAAKARAEGVDVLVVNQHLLAAHMAVHMEMWQDAVLPRTGPSESAIAWDTVIIDEAHELGDIAREFFGAEITAGRIASITRWLKASGFDPDPLNRASSLFFSDLDTRIPLDVRGNPEKVRVREGLDLFGLVDELSKARERCREVISGLAPRVKAGLASREETASLRKAESCARRIVRFTSWLEAAECPSESDEVVLWIERDKRGPILAGRHLESAEILASELWSRTRSVIATSATMRTGAGVRGSWAWIKRQLGAPESARTLSVASPFDFAAQARLVIAPCPDSRSDRDAFDRAVCETLDAVARGSLAHGGVLGLFTSRRMSDRAAAFLRSRGVDPVLAQGELPRKALLDAMRARPSVLCGTASLWTGVDLQGDSCVAVVVDKLPFAPPGDPVMDAISERLAAITGDQWAGFREESLPRAILRLRQGVGRLIRSVNDRGIVVLCDARLGSKGARYGQEVLASLDLPARTQSVGEAVEWLERGL